MYWFIGVIVISVYEFIYRKTYGQQLGTAPSVKQLTACIMYVTFYQIVRFASGVSVFTLHGAGSYSTAECARARRFTPFSSVLTCPPWDGRITH